MKKKGFTLVELLVVIAIIAMLLAILMPALNKVRQIAYRMVCGSNLSGIGKACLVYANDYDESYPVFGPSSAKWDFKLAADTIWDEPSTTSNPSSATTVDIPSSMFLLVKYADVSTAQFVCKATDTKKFELSTDTSKQNGTSRIKDVTEAWNFGKAGTAGSDGPWNWVSYAYQMPYTVASVPTGGTVNSITASSQAGMVVMADKSPWYEKGRINPTTGAAPSTTNTSGTAPYLSTNADDWGITAGKSIKKDIVRLANSPNHQLEGQNALFADSHVSFETQSNIGIEQDNIYTAWSTTTGQNQIEKQAGKKPASYNEMSLNQADSFLTQ